MDNPAYIAIGLIVGVSVLQAVTAAAETALERASSVRIHALAARGDLRAKSIAGTVDRPRELVGPLTVARVFSSATIVALFSYLGARSYSPAAGVIGFGLVGAVYVAIIQMTVSILAARGPETVALRMASVVHWSRIIFFIPAAILGLPSRLIARSLEAVTPDEEDILSLVEREEASGGVEEQEKRMIRGVIGLEDQTAQVARGDGHFIDERPLDVILAQLARAPRPGPSPDRLEEPNPFLRGHPREEAAVLRNRFEEFGGRADSVEQPGVPRPGREGVGDGRHPRSLTSRQSFP